MAWWRLERRMSQELWSAVDRYLTETLVAPGRDLDATLAANAQAGLPAIDVSAPQGKLLSMLASMVGAQRILEIGTLGGYSTIWLARALPPGGCLVTLEVDPRHATVAAENIRRAGMEKCVEIRIGPALDSLRRLADAGQGPFDLVFIDADKPSTADYFDWALRLTRPGSIIIADNVVRAGEIVNAGSDDERVRGMRRFVEVLAREPRVTATGLQTVGTKGYDGFVIARVNEV